MLRNWRLYSRWRHDYSARMVSWKSRKPFLSGSTSFCSNVKFLNSTEADLATLVTLSDDVLAFACSDKYTFQALSGSFFGGDRAALFKSLTLAAWIFLSRLCFPASDKGRATRFLGFGLAATAFFFFGFGLALVFGFAVFLAVVELEVFDVAGFFGAEVLPV
jgi:hypothetical protein